MDKPTLNNKVFTENPLLDEIIYNSRQLTMDTVLKDWDEAERAETEISAANGDIYISTMDGNINFDYFEYSTAFLMEHKDELGITVSDCIRYGNDNTLIPESLKIPVAKIAGEDFIKGYVEYNNYYRMLNGLPSYDETGVWKGLYIDASQITATNKSYSISAKYIAPSIEDPFCDYRLIHELSTMEIEILFDNDIIDSIINDSEALARIEVTKDSVLYLKRIGDRNIDYYTSRKAQKFQTLYIPACDSNEIRKRYKELLEANRMQTLYTIYSEAYKYGSKYYDKFMMIFIVIQTIIDMIIELPEYIIRKDVFDTRTCKYIFESSGVDYFSDIPIKYQVNLIKNLNKLLRFKSTDQCIIDIISIFGFDNVQAFKYYILKDRKVISTNPLLYADKKKTDGTPDNDANYGLKFIRVPVGEKYDDYIKDYTNSYDYDTIVKEDKYWTGDKDHQAVMSAIKNENFTVARSKYYSIEAVMDLTKKNFTICYFINILIGNDISKKDLLVNIPCISNKTEFELVDVVICLYTLGYVYYGVKDIIRYPGEEIGMILGYDLDADLQTISDDIKEKYGYNLLDLGIAKTEEEAKESGALQFIIPANKKILTFKELENIYNKNALVYNLMRENLINPKSKKIHDAYKEVYKTMFCMKMNYEYFEVSGEIPETYREFLITKAPLIYNFIQEIVDMTSVNKRQEACVNAIQSIIASLKEYINTITLDEVFSSLPSISMDFIKNYIAEVIEFFQSFLITHLKSSTIYILDDRLENYVQILEEIAMNMNIHPTDVVTIIEKFNNIKNEMYKSESVEVIDKVWLKIDRWIIKQLNDYVFTHGKIRPWHANLKYIPGDWVIYNNKVYGCLTQNSDPTWTPANWVETNIVPYTGDDSDTMYFYTTYYHGDYEFTHAIIAPWRSSTKYNPNELVIHDNKVYVCSVQNEDITWNPINWEETSITPYNGPDSDTMSLNVDLNYNDVNTILDIISKTRYWHTFHDYYNEAMADIIGGRRKEIIQWDSSPASRESIIWNGSIEGKECVVIGEDGTLYKIQDNNHLPTTTSIIGATMKSWEESPPILQTEIVGPTMVSEVDCENCFTITSDENSLKILVVNSEPAKYRGITVYKGIWFVKRENSYIIELTYDYGELKEVIDLGARGTFYKIAPPPLDVRNLIDGSISIQEKPILRTMNITSDMIIEQEVHGLYAIYDEELTGYIPIMVTMEDVTINGTIMHKGTWFIKSNTYYTKTLHYIEIGRMNVSMYKSDDLDYEDNINKVSNNISISSRSLYDDRLKTMNNAFVTKDEYKLKDNCYLIETHTD